MLSETDPATPATFTRFAERECAGRSAFYEHLCLGIAHDRDLLTLAGHARPGQPVPNLLLAAVQYLLLRDPSLPLARFYPGLSTAVDAGEPMPAFRAFCLEHGDTIASLLRTHLVQTAHVSRCTSLLPAFELVAERSQRPLALVEIGASAGLNLLWDRYRYEFIRPDGSGVRLGNPESNLHLSTLLRGDRQPPLNEPLPVVASRIGLDLNPIDLSDPDQVLWLRALIWPDEAGKRAQFEQAIRIALIDPPRLLAGDALDLLPAVLAEIPLESQLCIYHSYTVIQFSSEARQCLDQLLTNEAGRRDLFRISIEQPGGEHPRIDLTSYRDGVRTDELLAWCDAHGAWLEWLG